MTVKLNFVQFFLHHSVDDLQIPAAHNSLQILLKIFKIKTADSNNSDYISRMLYYQYHATK